MSRYRFLAPLLLLPLLTGCSEPNTAKLPPPPRDEFLISHFHQNRRSFTRVVEIAKGCMQPTGAYSFDRDDPARAMTPILTPFFLSCDADEDRHPEAARIVKELGVMSVVGNEHAVSFLASRFSAHHGDPLDTSGFEKGWEFIPDGADSPDSSVVVGSLDEVDINTEPSGVRCHFAASLEEGEEGVAGTGLTCIVITYSSCSSYLQGNKRDQVNSTALPCSVGE